jgi:hypothetical protein
MCYEMFFKKLKSTQEKQADKSAPTIERAVAARPQAQRQPVAQAKGEQETETELEIMGTA